MMKLRRTGPAVVACFAAAMISMIGARDLQAVAIEGGISLAGAYTPDNPDLSLATRIDFGPAVVISSSGDFSMPMFTPVSMANSLVYDPLFSVDTNPLWSVGGFEFELYSLSIVHETASSITLNGLGNVTHGSFDNTTGNWTATFNSDGDSTFSWSSSTASVADGGVTLTLFGVGLVCVGWYRRRSGGASEYDGFERATGCRSVSGSSGCVTS